MGQKVKKKSNSKHSKQLFIALLVFQAVKETNYRNYRFQEEISNKREFGLSTFAIVFEW